MPSLLTGRQILYLWATWEAHLPCYTYPGIKINGRNINNLRYADDTTLTAENEEELKSLLMKVKWKSWLKEQNSEN